MIPAQRENSVKMKMANAKMEFAFVSRDSSKKVANVVSGNVVIKDKSFIKTSGCLISSIFPTFSVGKGRLGYPCLPGGACADYTSVCQHGICICRETFYEKDKQCGKFVQ